MRKVETINRHNETHAEIDLVSLLNPAEYFSSPKQVLEAPTLSKQEKRAILASWASDQYAVESVPALRELPGSHALVRIQDILAALKQLDGPHVEIQRSWTLRWPKRLKRYNEYPMHGANKAVKKILEGDIEMQNSPN
ncbi:hypothetical protein IHQ71_04245 [Rhizobium sp. TH2]|uniref:hypothetical protein n=1 Tax=Rhizobium sp. TH2 TaxID=2775403 RepID=UPI002157FA15|nr:hypothetical protein [Rhizobium sp. TH2]UVC09831.1 hypothetical protein IHQ71_04245 [Rhizobium sp. TH2]